MIKSFHNLDIPLDDYEIEGKKYIWCQIEDKERPLTPEEEVRQAAISFFVNFSKINLKDFSIQVEYKNMDIVFYGNTHLSNFSPSCYPVFIVEVKRDYTNLKDWEFQISNYMNQNFCANGLLLNSQKIFFYSILGENLTQKEIALTEINDIFSNFQEPFPDSEIMAFQSASQGDFVSFKFLAEKYGKSSKISFLCKGLQAPIKNAFWIKFIGDFICFDYHGGIAGSKQHKVRMDSFLKLMSIMK